LPLLKFQPSYLIPPCIKANLTSKNSVNTPLWLIVLYKTAGGRQSFTCFDRSSGHLHTVRTRKMCRLLSGMFIWILRYQSSIWTYCTYINMSK